MSGYRATTMIRYGGIRSVKNPDTGEVEQVNSVHTFNRGDMVTGLTKGEMAALWETGALEKVESTPTAEPVKVAAEPEKGSAEGAATSGEKSGGDD